jgi:hypothetical protein
MNTTPLLAGLMIVLLRAIFPAEADIQRRSQAAWHSDTAFLTLRTFLTRRTTLLFCARPAGGVGCAANKSLRLSGKTFFLIVRKVRKVRRVRSHHRPLANRLWSGTKQRPCPASRFHPPNFRAFHHAMRKAKPTQSAWWCLPSISCT